MMRVKFGVQTGQGGYDYSALKRFWVEADRLGYHSAVLYDHFYSMSPPRTKDNLEAWTTVAVLASETENLRIGHLVLCNSYRHPSLLAKMASTLDVLSGGRLEFGIGAGWYEEEYREYGFPFPRASVRIRQLNESLQIIRKMWTEDRATFRGKHYTIVDAICNPKPSQKPHPPILIGGGGEKLTLRVVARHADIWNFGWDMDPKGFGERVELLEAHCDSVGRDPEEIEKSHNKMIFISEDEAKAQRMVRDRAKRIGIALEEYRRRLEHAAVGTPEACIENLEMYRDVGVTYFFLTFPNVRDLEPLRLFARKVMPAFR